MSPAAAFAKAILNLDHFEDQQDAVLDIVQQAMMHGRHEANAQHPLLFALALRISSRVCEETASGGMRCTSSNPSNPGAWCDSCYAFNALDTKVAKP